MKGTAWSARAMTGSAWRRTTLAGVAATMVSAALAQGSGSPSAAAPEPSAPYLDRVIDPGTLPDDALMPSASAYDTTGWPRSLRVDYSVFSQRGANTTLARALGVNGFIDTPDYGALSLNANVTTQRTDESSSLQGHTWRIDQRAMPLNGGWRANHNAGDINTISTSLARGMGRVFLPTTPIRGLGGQWYLGEAINLNAAVGNTGLFNGLDLASFEPSGGRVASAGGQFSLPTTAADAHAHAAFQVFDGRGITDGTLGHAQDTRAVFAATAWEGSAPWAQSVAPGALPISEHPGGLRLQGNAVRSTASRSGNALGLWADAAWRTQRWHNTAGVFRFEPNLRWGTAVLASDLQGVYWQTETSTRQWQAGFSTEVSDSVSHSAPSLSTGRSAFVNLNGRYRLDTRNSIGAALNLRALTSPGQALLLNWDQTSDWGQTQWHSDLANTGGSRTTRLGVDQSWPVIFPASLSTSLAWERVAGGPSPSTGWIWGLLGSVSPLPQWSLDAALRGAQRSTGAKSLNANIGIRWLSASGWSLTLRYTESHGQEPLSALVVSALTAATLASTTTPTSRSMQLLLSYEGRAGSAKAPLGGLPGSGSGTLNGTVYFDADANGRHEAAEAGVPGVTVILDRRFVTRTDAQGRYEFSAVAAGEHLIEVSPDNVPLPWSPVQRDPVSTTLQVRQRTTVDFAVQRDH